MRQSIFLFFFCSFLNVTYAQYQINLDNVKVNLREKNFQIVDVQDWRSNKGYLGVVYRGMSNNPKVAVIDGEVAEKIGDMIQSSDHDTKLIIGLKKLAVKEMIKAMFEFGYIEVEIHVVEKLNQGYNDLGIYRSTLKYDEGADVTNLHAEKIGLAIKGAVDQISLTGKHNKIASLEELINQKADVKWTDLPTINLDKVTKGLYLTFTSLKSGNPDSLADSQIRGGKKPTLYLKNEKGKFKRYEGISYFIVANETGVFVGFENNYFQTAVRKGKWVFIGPKRSDIEAINTGLLAAGLVGGGIVGAATKDQFIYQINTLDGSIRAVEKIR